MSKIRIIPTVPYKDNVAVRGKNLTTGEYQEAYFKQ